MIILFTCSFLDDITGVGDYQRRPDEAKMYLSFITCLGHEERIADCHVSGGPEAGIERDGKVYCQQRGEYYYVARINCCESTSIRTRLGQNKD